MHSIDRPLIANLSSLTPHVVPDLAAMIDVGVAAESWGAGAVSVGDHVVWTEHMQHPSGRPFDRAFIDSVPDPFIVLGAIAARTNSIHLMPATLVGGARHPLLLARMAASLSQVACGRLHLGIAAGWLREEFEALGMDFDERFARMDEALKVCTTMWPATHGVSFDGRFTTFRDVLMTPPPFGGNVPFWIGGGSTPATARRVARYGEGWIASIKASPDDISAAVELISAECDKAGRPAGSIGYIVQLGMEPVPRPGRDASLDARVEHLVTLSREVIARGATHVSLSLGQFSRDVAEAEHIVRALSREVQRI